MNPDIEDVKCYIYSPYIGHVLVGFCDLNLIDRFEHFIIFLHNKFTTLLK